MMYIALLAVIQAVFAAPPTVERCAPPPVCPPGLPFTCPPGPPDNDGCAPPPHCVNSMADCPA